MTVNHEHTAPHVHPHGDDAAITEHPHVSHEHDHVEHEHAHDDGSHAHRHAHEAGLEDAHEHAHA
jgi:hypothetical protein